MDAQVLKPQKFQMMMEKEALAAIDEWSFRNRVRTRAEAMRRLIALGLKAEPETQKADAQA